MRYRVIVNSFRDLFYLIHLELGCVKGDAICRKGVCLTFSWAHIKCMKCLVMSAWSCKPSLYFTLIYFTLLYISPFLKFYYLPKRSGGGGTRSFGILDLIVLYSYCTQIIFCYYNNISNSTSYLSPLAYSFDISQICSDISF